MATYLIIGASSGIGKELASELSREGHTVFGTYHRNKPGPGEDAVNYHHLDVLQDKIELDFLPPSIDGIAYCPGSINLKPFARIKSSDFVDDFQLNVAGAIKVIQTVLPRLKQSGSPSIILFSTVAVQLGLNFHSMVSASKGALEGLTRALAAELSPTIRVNCIAPSLTDTPLAASLLNTDEKKEANAQRHPLKKIGKTEDIAAMASFLLSPKAGWITGQVIHVDGGMSTIK
jgi:NAD(P)-dependent dehydrogenase (short-subunit alcohol dehydrogenase family)